MRKNINLISLLGVEGMVTPKTLASETIEDVKRKTPNDMSLDIRALLDDLNICVAKQDIEGMLQCISAIKLRTDCMEIEAIDIKKLVDRSKKK